MDDSFLQKLLVAKGPEQQAAVVAEVLFSTLPENVSLVARRCCILHWFDESIVKYLLADIALSADQCNEIYHQLGSLPFIESLPWGLAFNSLTRDGLLTLYAETQPEFLMTAARLAASGYKAYGEDETTIAETLFCYVIAGETVLARNLLDEQIKLATTSEKKEHISGFLRLIQEAQLFPFVNALATSDLVEVRSKNTEPLPFIGEQLSNREMAGAGSMRMRRIVSNTHLVLVAQIVTWISMLSLLIAYGWFLSALKFGELYFAATFVSLIGFPVEFGFNQQLTRDAAQMPDRALHHLSNTIYIKFLLWLIGYSLMLTACWLLSYPPEVQVLVVIYGLILLSDSIKNAISSLYNAFERTSFPALGIIIEKGLSILIGVITLRSGAGVQVMAWILFGSSLANTLWQAIWVVRLMGISFKIDLPLMKKLMSNSIPFLVYGITGIVYYRIDTVFLSLMAGMTVVGWYGAGYRLFDLLVFLPSLGTSVIMHSIFFKSSVHGEKGLKIAIEKAVNFLLLCEFPISAGLIVAAPAIIEALYHQVDFLHAIPVIQLLAPGLIFLSINSVLISVLISVDLNKKITIMTCIALLFNVSLNLILIPMYQHIGAAAVTSLTEFLLMCLSVMFIPRSLRPLGSLKVALKTLVAGLVMALAIWLALLLKANLVLILPVAVMTYLGTVALFKTIPRQDLRDLYNFIRNRGRDTALDDQPHRVSQRLEDSELDNKTEQFQDVNRGLTSEKLT